MNTAQVLDPRPAELGEGPLWHPKLGLLFWFDITNNLLMCQDGREWNFDRHVSAAGWVDASLLLVASETDLFLFNLENGTSDRLCPLEEDNAITRSNDGRADPWGGFWIGTMGKEAQRRAGSIYRYYKGELRQLFPKITISNAICFSPDGSHAYFCDTLTRKIMRVRLADLDGWPVGEPEVFLDLRAEELNPDGAVVTADGLFANAQWGAERVALYDTEGKLVDSFEFPTDHVSCPAFGGTDLSTLFATTARQGLSKEQLSGQRFAGCTFQIATDLKGQSEHKVVL